MREHTKSIVFETINLAKTEVILILIKSERTIKSVEREFHSILPQLRERVLQHGQKNSSCYLESWKVFECLPFDHRRSVPTEGGTES